MIEAGYITQLERHYKTYLKKVISGQDFEPIVLRGGKNRPQTTVELHTMVQAFQKHDKNIQANGWRIEWEEWSSRKFGRQQWPASVTVETEEDYLFLLNKQVHADGFKKQLQELLSWRPPIRDFLFHRPESVLGLQNDWKEIWAVVDYLLQHAVDGCYIRSLPVPVHTKFIEQNKPTILSLLQYLAPERFSPDARVLEDALRLRRKPYLFTMRWLDDNHAVLYTAGMQVLGITTENLTMATWTIRQIILVENETNLYLLPDIPGTVAICSAGLALHLLAEIPLLVNNPVYYWGDIDEHGFIMLNSLRKLYPNVESLFMNDETVRLHEQEMVQQPAKYRMTHLALLHPPEHQAFDWLHSRNGRIEQEKLQQSYVAERLKVLM